MKWAIELRFGHLGVALLFREHVCNSEWFLNHQFEHMPEICTIWLPTNRCVSERSRIDPLVLVIDSMKSLLPV
jgi:hypothetical protein